MEETKVVHKKKKIVPKLRFDGFKDEWKSKNIGSILSVGSGRDYKHLGNGNIPVFGTGGLMTMVDKFLYDGATVCIGRKGTIDKPMYFEGKIWTVDTLFYTHSFLDSNPKFVYNLFQKIKWKEHNEASGVPSLSKTTIEKIKINIPSLPEQQKIASFLSAVDEKIQLLNRKKQLLEQYKKGMMQQLFSGKLRFKPDAVAEPSRSYPKWEEKKLGDVSVFLDGRRKPIKGEDRAKIKGQYPYYGASGIIDYVNEYIFDEDIILLGEDGENIISRNLPLAFRVSGKCWVNNHAHVIKPNQGTDINFLTYSLERVNYVPYNTGTAQPKLNQEVCRNIPLTMPCLEEQKKIADFLSAIDVKIESLSNQISQTQNFKKGLLQQMFV